MKRSLNKSFPPPRAPLAFHLPFLEIMPSEKPFASSIPPLQESFPIYLSVTFRL